MDKLEKVIKGLECCSDAVSECGKNCPYWIIKNCQSRLQADALALLKAQEQKCRECGEATSKAIQELQAKLKAQEPVKPIENAGFYYCGAYKYAFTSARQKYCSDCGRKVKWE